jgi:glutaredoxin
MPPAVVTFISKPGCHLCDEARTTVLQVLEECQTLSLRFEERSILDDPDLMDKYVEQIPVLLLNGKVHNFWHIDPVRLTTALKGLA